MVVQFHATAVPPRGSTVSFGLASGPRWPSVHGPVGDAPPPPRPRRHGALLFFDRATGTNVLLEGPACRAFERRAPRVAHLGLTNRCNLARARMLAARGARFGVNLIVTPASLQERWTSAGALCDHRSPFIPPGGPCDGEIAASDPG